MDFVLDASVAGSWVFEDEETELSQRILDHMAEGCAIVPTQWWFEVRNLLLSNELRNRVTPERSAEFLSDIAGWAVVLDHAPNSDDLMRLARAHNLTAYDAAYLELAIRRGLPIAALDRRMLAAARSEKIPILEESN